MKRVLNGVLFLAALLALAVPAYADILWEPQDNRFYETHRGQCESEERNYHANGPEGFVTAWDAPEGGMVIAQYPNGEALRVYFIYQDWGLVARWEDGRETSGWIPMAQLSLIYDYLSFAEEYGDRITPYAGEFADYAGGAEVVNFYDYPGAPEVSQALKTEQMGDVLGNLTGTAEGDSYISGIFVDENGRTWGYVNYMYGHLNSWFCLDEPDGTDFPIREVSARELVPARTPVLPARSYVPYLLVAVVAAVTGGLLAFFYGRKRKSAK